jgi:hypothetical protein
MHRLYEQMQVTTHWKVRSLCYIESFSKSINFYVQFFLLYIITFIEFILTTFHGYRFQYVAAKINKHEVF